MHQNNYLDPKLTFKEIEEFLESIRKALYMSKICSYAQGFDQMKRLVKTISGIFD